jgi:hypothetical protein
VGKASIVKPTILHWIAHTVDAGNQSSSRQSYCMHLQCNNTSSTSPPLLLYHGHHCPIRLFSAAAAAIYRII